MHRLVNDFQQIALTNPEHTALVIDDRSYSYSFLFKQAQLTAAWLTQNKIKRLGIIADRTLNNYIGILACLLAGGTYVPLNSKAPEDRINLIKQQAEVDAIFSNQKSNHAWVPIDYPLTQTAYLLFTSGSTGKPKGIAVSFDNLNHFVDSLQQRHQITPKDRIAQHADISFDMSVYDIFMAWNAGATLYVVPEARRLAPLKFITENKISVWFSVPSVIKIMQKLNLLKQDSMPCLRLSLFSGEVLTLGAAKAWQSAATNSLIDNLYGPTEATVECIGQYITCDQYPHLNAEQGLPIGKPLAGNLIAILNEQQQWVEPNESGEIAIAGPQVVSDYWKNPALTQKRFIKKEHPTFGMQRWFLTRDKGYQDDKGVFHYLCRLDNQVKLNGHRVELDEIEYHLKQISQCTEAAVLITAQNGSIAKSLTGFIVTKHLDQEKLLVKLKAKLPSYMVPNKIVITDKLPYNLNGKLDRQALAELCKCD